MGVDCEDAASVCLSFVGARDVDRICGWRGLRGHFDGGLYLDSGKKQVSTSPWLGFEPRFHPGVLFGTEKGSACIIRYTTRDDECWTWDEYPLKLRWDRTLEAWAVAAVRCRVRCGVAFQTLHLY